MYFHHRIVNDAKFQCLLLLRLGKLVAKMIFEPAVQTIQPIQNLNTGSHRVNFIEQAYVV